MWLFFWLFRWNVHVCSSWNIFVHHFHFKWQRGNTNLSVHYCSVPVQNTVDDENNMNTQVSYAHTQFVILSAVMSCAQRKKFIVPSIICSFWHAISINFCTNSRINFTFPMYSSKLSTSKIVTTAVHGWILARICVCVFFFIFNVALNWCKRNNRNKSIRIM